MVDLDMLGDFIADQRRKAGMTQEDLAAKSGVCVRTIRNLETKAQRYPRKSTIELLLDAVAASGSAQHLLGDYGRAPAAPDHAGFGRPGGARGLPGCGHGLRRCRGRLVGQRETLEQVSAWLIRERMVLLTGPGGVGKTKLACAVAEQLRARFRHGVTVIELGGLPPEQGDPARATRLVADAFAATIGTLARHGGNEPGRAANELHALLVVDNCEHVAGAVSAVADAVMSEHPLIHLLFTSRRHLGALGAHTWAMQPLAVEATAEQAWPDAVELFMLLIRTACPTLDLTGQGTRVTELCRRLGGLPYAIELATSRMRGVSLEVQLQEGPSIALLNDLRLDGYPHQRTLSASLQWSHDLLTEDQQCLLRRLTEFPGSFTSQDVKRLAAVETTGNAGVLGVLADLVDASLVALVRGYQYWYRLQPFVAEYLAQQPRPARHPAARTALSSAS